AKAGAGGILFLAAVHCSGGPLMRLANDIPPESYTMNRFLFLAAGLLLFVPSPLRADSFDRYINPILTKAPGADGVQEVKQLTPGVIADNDRVLPNITGALVIVQTNQGRFSKLLVRTA